GDYVLNYTDQLAQAVKKTYRQYYKNKWNEIEVSILTPLHTKYDQENELLTLFHKYHEILEKITNEKETFMDYQNQLDMILRNENSLQSNHVEEIEQLISLEQIDKVVDMTDLIKQQQDMYAEPEHEEKMVQQGNYYSYQQTLEDVEH